MKQFQFFLHFFVGKYIEKCIINHGARTTYSYAVNLCNVKSELYLNMNGGKQSRGFVISIQASG